MSGFTKEQLALAKQLQASYCSSGTFRSQNSTPYPQGQSSNSNSRPQPVQQASRMPPVTQPVRSQSATTVRSSNGLVRPLPSRAPPASTSSNYPTPAPSGTTRPAPVNPTPSVSQIAPKSTHAVQPVTRPIVQPVTWSAPSPEKVSSQAPATPSSQPVSQMTYSSAPPVQPISQPVRKQSTLSPQYQTAMTPTPMHKTAPLQHIGQSGAQPALVSMETPKYDSVPAVRPPQVSQNTELLKNAFPTSHHSHTTVSAAYENVRSQGTDMSTKTPEVVREAININKMGKPVKWNWMSEAPVVREPGPEELAEMKASPPVNREDLPWTRPFHANAIMKAPGMGGDGVGVEEGHRSVPRRPVGLKGSRHA